MSLARVVSQLRVTKEALFEETSESKYYHCDSFVKNVARWCLKNAPFPASLSKFLELLKQFKEIKTVYSIGIWTRIVRVGDGQCWSIDHHLSPSVRASLASNFYFLFLQMAAGFELRTTGLWSDSSAKCDITLKRVFCGRSEQQKN